MSEQQGAPPGQAANEVPEKSYRLLTSHGESMAAIDELIAAATVTLRIFDITLANRGFNTRARAQKLRDFLAAGRSHRIQIALHETDPLERDCPRIIEILRQFPMSVEIHRTLAQAREATDPFMVADDHSVWHQMHYTQPRSIIAIRSPADAVPRLQRFEEIWDLSEPAVAATKLGL